MMRKIFLYFLFITLILTSLSGFINSPTALILGFFFTFLLKQPFPNHTGRLIQTLLKFSIVGLGFGMDLTQTLKTGKEAFPLTLMSILATFFVGFLLTRFFKVEPKLGHLISSGTSICGGSAIAALSPVIKARPRTISFALGVVFILNSVALFTFPVIGNFLHMTQYQFGLWSAIAIHDTSSVIGASMDYGKEALEVATTVKLARSLWIIPVSFISMFLFKNHQKIKIPWFILFFALSILLNSYREFSIEVTEVITESSKRLLVLTLFLIGTTISIKEIKQAGAKPFLLGTLLWIFVSIGSLLLIIA